MARKGLNSFCSRRVWCCQLPAVSPRTGLHWCTGSCRRSEREFRKSGARFMAKQRDHLVNTGVLSNQCWLYNTLKWSRRYTGVTSLKSLANTLTSLIMSSQYTFNNDSADIAYWNVSTSQHDAQRHTHLDITWTGCLGDGCLPHALVKNNLLGQLDEQCVWMLREEDTLETNKITTDMEIGSHFIRDSWHNDARSASMIVDYW